MKHFNFNKRQDRGFGLLEVVLGIAVFAFGFLALMQLQTSLARSSSDANTRTVAASIAEELIEGARGFTQVTADAGNGRIDYNEIVSYDGAASVTVGELNYTANVIVNDHYWDASEDEFTDTKPVGIVNSDLKTMDIVVAWRPLEDGESFDDHNSINFDEGGAVRIIEIVPSTPGLLGALVSAAKDAAGGPMVKYNPGANPDIVRISLDGPNDKFKESTSPTPDVIRDEAVETWFDVVTYSQAEGADAIFLRREEFVAVTCECELETSPAVEDQGLPPTLWNGVTYTERDKVAKNIGTVPGGVQQSAYCGVCCRDHHDGADGAEDVYNILTAGDGTGDHDHYSVDRRGNVNDTPAGNGDTYLEACRMVRKDGFMRVTQDANQGALIGFPEGYLEFGEGAIAYSDYVVGAVNEYYGVNDQESEFSQPAEWPDAGYFPARTSNDPTSLPTPIFTNSQQLRSRAVYTDYLTSAAQSVIDKCFPTEDRGDDCPASTATSVLEIYPFFDLQMTWLARWNNVTDSGSTDGVVSVSNEAIETDNTHSRGLAALISSDGGLSDIEIEAHKGNLGLTSTGPIDHDYDGQLEHDDLWILDNDGGTMPPIGFVIGGGLASSNRRVDAAELVFEAVGAICGQTNTTWSCVVADGDGGGGTLTISNYFLPNPRMSICSGLEFVSETVNSTTFILPAIDPGVEVEIFATDDPDDDCHVAPA